MKGHVLPSSFSHHQLRARLLSAFADPSSDDVLSATHLKDLDNDDESSSSSPPSPVLLYFRFERTVVFCSLGKLAFTFVQVFLGIELFTLNPNEHSRDWLVFYINSDTVKVTWLDLVAPILRYVILAAALWYTSLSAHLSDDDVMSERGSFSASDDDGLNDDGPVFISQDEPSDLHALPDDGKTNNNLSSYMTNYTPSSSSTSIFARMVNAIVSTFQSSSSSSSSSAFRSFPHSHRHSHPPHHHGSSSQSRSSSSIRFSRSEVGHSVSASASMSMSISIPPVLSLQIPARRQLSPSAERRRFAGVSISQSIDELDVALLDASAPEHSMLSV